MKYPKDFTGSGLLLTCHECRTGCVTCEGSIHQGECPVCGKEDVPLYTFRPYYLNSWIHKANSAEKKLHMVLELLQDPRFHKSPGMIDLRLLSDALDAMVS